MKKNIILRINDELYVKIQQSGDFDEWFRYDEVTITFHCKKEKWVIFNKDFLIYALRVLKGLLEFAILDNLQLDESIKLDIGYLWNECLQDKPLDFKYIKNESYDYWVGQDYLLWSSNKGLTSTWLYNKNNKIYLEITPTYKWHHLEPKKNDKNYIPYDEYIKDYKPIVIVELDKEIAKEWLAKTEELLKIIPENDKLYFDKEV